MSGTGSEQRFSAKIYKVGINPCVDVPQRVSRGFAKRGHIPVVMALKGHRFRATLVPTGGGRHRLYINGEMRKTAGVDTGDVIRLALKVDTGSREIAVPRDFANALRRTKGAKAAFGGLTRSHRHEVVRWIVEAKRPETRARRIAKAIDYVLKYS